MRGNELRIRRRRRRQAGLRKRIRGTTERPRLSVFRSGKHIYAQVIDDERGVTVCEASTRSKELRTEIKYGGNVEAAKTIGELVAKRALDRNVTVVCFDRGGYRYHGRVRKLAEAAREAGLQF